MEKRETANLLASHHFLSQLPHPVAEETHEAGRPKHMFSPISYLLSGIMALLMSWALSGCRLGNHVEQEKPPEDPLSGYYQTAAQSSIICVNTSNADGTSCKTLSPHVRPPYEMEASGIPSIFSNPTAVLLQEANAGKGVAVMVNPYTYSGSSSPQVAVQFDEKYKNFSISGDTGYSYLLSNTKRCITNLSAEIVGSVNPFSGGDQTFEGYSTRGRMTLFVQLIQNFVAYTADSNSCPNDMKAIQDCYQDTSKCWGSSDDEKFVNKSWAQSYMNPLIEAGVITADDIQYITAIAFQIAYE